MATILHLVGERLVKLQTSKLAVYVLVNGTRKNVSHALSGHAGSMLGCLTCAKHNPETTGHSIKKQQTKIVGHDGTGTGVQALSLSNMLTQVDTKG